MSEKEYEQATRAYPSLLFDSSDLNYDGYSATAGINVGEQGYFDNETILHQFERLFQLLSFKKEYKDHDIEIVVDNARTHSACEYNINEFRKGIGKNCPVHALEYLDHEGHTISVPCYFEKGENQGKSKGLLELAKDLKVSVHSSIKLPELRALLANHPAFKSISKLEKPANKYQVRVIFVPKFHCELNAIEGMWCHMKQLVRKMTDQTFPTMMRLIPESRENFAEKQIQLKLFRRFWRSLDVYEQGESYGEVLRFYFSGRSKQEVSSHRKINNSQLF